MNQVATKYHIPIHKQRYWNFRHNKGETESKPISYEYMLAVGVALDGQWFFVEEIPEVDVVRIHKNFKLTAEGPRYSHALVGEEH